MSATQFISNHGKINHGQNLIQLLTNTDEVWIATAFLKMSGLQSLLPLIKKLVKTGKQIRMVAGQHFALTEPEALHEIRRLFLNSPEAKLFIAHASKATEVFHPKLFLFRKGREASIVSGSANITEGGLSKNTESSLLFQTTVNDNVWKDAIAFFHRLISPQLSEEATLLAIKRYESFYDRQKIHNRKSKAIPERKKSQQNFNYENLLSHFKSFNNKERQLTFEEKTQNYADARKVLDTIADSSKLTKSEFSILLEKLVGAKGQSKLWHSGSMFRHKRKVFPSYNKFRTLVGFIRNNLGDSPSNLFTKSRELVDKIAGAGVNYITEMMMTYDPINYANLNINPITVLKREGDVYIKSSAISFSGDDYEEFCQLVSEISKKLGLRNMLEADSFFNDIYWKIKKKHK